MQPCPQCGRYVPRGRKFCNQVCYAAYRAAHADRSPAARARRRAALAQAYIDGALTDAAYQAKLAYYRENDLI